VSKLTSGRFPPLLAVIALLAVLAWILSWGVGGTEIPEIPRGDGKLAAPIHAPETASSPPDGAVIRTPASSGHRVQLKIVDADTGRDLPGIPVTLRETTRTLERPSHTHQIRDRLTEIAHGSTDDEGNVDFAVPDKGYYAVSVRDDFVYIVDGDTIHVNDGPRERHHVYATVGGRIIGYMFDPNGLGVSDGLVYTNVGRLKSLSGERVEGRPSPFAAAGERVMRTDADGRYVVYGVPKGAKLRVIGLHPNLCGARLTVLGGGRNETVMAPPLRMTTGGKLVVRVLRDAGDAAIVGARVVFSPSRGSAALHVEQRTDESGIASFDGLPEGPHHAIVLAPDCAIQRVPIQVPNPEGEVTVRLSQSGGLSGWVVDRHTREPVPAARVDARIRFDRSTLSLSKLSGHPFTTDSNGKFRIPFVPDGPVAIYCYHPDYITRTKIKASSPAADISIEIDPQNILRGVVVDGNDAPVNQFDVAWKRVDESRWRGPQRHSESQGKFAIRGLEDGKWIVRVTTVKEYAMSSPVETRAPSTDPSTADLKLVLKPKRALSGRVVDLANGEPLAGVSVRIGPRPDSQDSLGDVLLGRLFAPPLPMAETKTDPAGVFSVLVGEDLPIHVFVQPPGYEPHSEKLDAAEWARIKLRALDTFRGVVRFANGEPAVHGRVFAMRKDSPIPIATARIDSTGRFELHASPRVHVIRIASSAKRGATRTWSIERQINPADRREGAEFTVRNEDGVLQGILNSGADPIQDCPVLLTMAASEGTAWNPSAPTATARTDSWGRFEFKGIAPGRYTWRVLGKKRLEGTVRVSAGEHAFLNLDLDRRR
jgi:uncharacterized GH25 family protein